LHFAPGTRIRDAGDGSFDVELGEARAKIIVSGAHIAELAVEQDWISDRYGERERAPVLIASGRRAFPTTLDHTVSPL
jgi:hypothetical protein